MTGQEIIAGGYTVSVREPADSPDGYHVLYTPRRLQVARENGGAPKKVCPDVYEVVVREEGDRFALRWVKPPVTTDVPLADFETDAVDRVQALREWLERLWSLIRSVDEWVKKAGWDTRVVEKSMQDTEIGKYKVPGLLMQEGTDRILLEPIGRSAPGVDGIVDLYLMPAYDDIASLYYYDGRWNLHYIFPGVTGVPNTREAPAQPLSEETLQKVLAEMRQHAA